MQQSARGQYDWLDKSGRSMRGHEETRQTDIGVHEGILEEEGAQ